MLEHRRQLTWALSGIVAILVGLSVVAVCLELQLAPGEHWEFYGYVPLFHLDKESNVPTWFSSSLLLVCSALLGSIALGKTSSTDDFRAHWWILCAGFVFLSMDETAVIHEKLIRIDRLVGNPSGVFLFAWVIPALIGVPLLGLAYLRFLRHLPPKFRRGFLISAAIYLGGAIGMEMAGGAYLSSGTVHTALTYSIITHVEETLELSGIVFFLSTLLELLAMLDRQPPQVE